MALLGLTAWFVLASLALSSFLPPPPHTVSSALWGYPSGRACGLAFSFFWGFGARVVLPRLKLQLLGAGVCHEDQLFLFVFGPHLVVFRNYS